MASDFIPNPGVRIDGKLASPKATTRKNLSTDMKVGRKNIFDYTDSTISDGSTDAKAAIEAADTDGPVILSPGTYAIASNTTLNKKPLIEPGAKLKPASGVTLTLTDGYVAEDTQHIFDLSAGGTVIIPTGQRFTVSHVGAIGDNSTDNLTFFQKAITIAKASSAELIIPSGTYLFSAELLTGSATGLTIRGTDPQKSKLKFTGTTTWGGSFTFAVCDKIVIQDLFFEGTSDDVAGIYVFNGSTNIRVQNCTFANWGTGIAAPHGAIELEGVTGVVVTNCEVYGGLGNVNSDIRLTNCSDIVCEGNLLRSANADGITVSNTVTSESIFNLSANTIRGKYRHGILLGYGEHHFRGTVAGNSIYDCNTNGIYVQSGGDPAGELSIVGNTINYCGGGQAGDGAGNAGIHLSGNLGGTVSGNTLVNCGYDTSDVARGTGRGRGILLSFAENWTVTGNTIVNSAMHGIGVNDSGPLKNILISGNTIVDAVDGLMYLGEAHTTDRQVYILDNTLTCLNKDCHGIYFYETNGTSHINIKGNEITGLKSGTSKSAIKWGVEKYKKVDVSNNTFKNWDYAFTSTANVTNQNEDWAFGRCIYLDHNTYDNVTTPFNIRKDYIHSAVGANNRFINTTPGYNSKLVPASFINGRLEGYFVDNLPNKKCRVGDRLKPLNVVDGDSYEWFVRSNDQPAATAFVVSSGNIFTDVAHGLTQNAVIRFTGGSLPTPIVANKDYFVTGIPNADTFTISEALNGATLTLTSTGSGNYQLQEFTPTWQSDIYDWLNRKQIVKHRWNGDGNNDTIGDPTDIMSGSNMVWSGTVAYTTPPSGKGEGKAFQLNGSSSYLKATTDEYSDTETFTVCGWVKLDTTTGTRNIVNTRDTTGGWQLSQDAGILYLQTALATLTSSYSSELSVGTWAHIAIVFNGANSVLYVNGIQRAATFTADWGVPSTHFLELGAISSYTTQYLDGELFDWRLYERALTQSQLLGLINGPSFGGDLLISKLPGRHNPLDYTLSAIYGGVVDARYAILQADANGPVVLQPGTYAIASNMTLTNNIRFDPGAKLKPASGIVITLSGGYSAEDTQHVFDLSAGGSFVVQNASKVSSVNFGADPTGVVDSTDELNAFFECISENDCGIAICNGIYLVSDQLTLGPLTTDIADGQCRTKNIYGAMIINCSGAFDTVLLLQNSYYITWKGLVRIKGVGGSYYNTRTVTNAVILRGLNHAQLDGFYIEYMLGDAVLFDSEDGDFTYDNTVTDIFALDCGSTGVPDIDFTSVIGTWNTRVDTGSSGGFDQRTTITLSNLPPASCDDIPKTLLIAGNLYHVVSMNRADSKVTLYPWIMPVASTSGSYKFIYGSGVRLTGSEVAGNTIKHTSLLRTGKGLSVECLYGPNVGILQTQAVGVGMSVGKQYDAATIGANVDRFYGEELNLYHFLLKTLAAKSIKIGTMAPAELSKIAMCAAPTVSVWDIPSPNYQYMLGCSFGTSQGVIEPNKPLNNSEAYTGTVTLNVAQRDTVSYYSNSLTVTLSLPESAIISRLGIDAFSFTVFGSGVNGAPTGSITIAPPSGWKLNSGTTNATLVLTKFSQATTIYGYMQLSTQNIIISRNDINVSASTADLESITSAINTVYKYEGKQVFNVDTNKPVYALGSPSNAQWVDATGSTVHTPI